MTNWKFSWGPFYNIYEPNIPPNRTTDSAVPIYDPPSSDPVRTTGYGVPVYDPPHGDYYSKPSQPKYAVPCDGLTGAEWTRRLEDRWRGTAAELLDVALAKQSDAVEAAFEQERARVRRESLLKRQECAEPFAVAYYFWLGIDAEHRLW